MVPPYGPSSRLRIVESDRIVLETSAASTRLAGLRRKERNFARRLGFSSSPSLRPTTRHSAIPVSEENDIPCPLDAMLTTVKSVYLVAIRSRNFVQDDPLTAVNGSTSATTPPGRSFLSASDANAQAKPACPWYEVSLAACLRRAAISDCSSCVASNAANAAFKTPASAS